jgi:hypothetical protein
MGKNRLFFALSLLVAAAMLLGACAQATPTAILPGETAPDRVGRLRHPHNLGNRNWPLAEPVRGGR